MSDNGNHPHPHPEADQPQPTPQVQRRPSDATIIERLNMRLNEKAEMLRNIEDREVYLDALCKDLDTENQQIRGMMSQMAAENLLLRTRLGLGPTDPVELTDEEEASLPEGAQVVELPDREAVSD